MNGIKRGSQNTINLLQKNAAPAPPTAIQTAKSQQLATLLPKSDHHKRNSYNLKAVFGLIKIIINQLVTPSQKEKGKTLNPSHHRNSNLIEERSNHKQGDFTQSNVFFSHQHQEKIKHKKHNNADESITNSQLVAFNVENINKHSIHNTQKAFESNKEKWQQSEIKNYTYSFQRSCFCTREATREVLTHVKNGTAVNSQFKDTNSPVPNELSFNKLSINDLFTTIEAAIDKNVAVIRVKYNNETGQPTLIYIDGKTGITDDEFSLTANNLTISQD
jgi:hypothetical protein